MSQYSDELRGALFRNNAKRPDKQDADYRGQCEIAGVPYYIDAWINAPKAGGDKFMALRFKRKDLKQRDTSPPAPSDPSAPRDPDDDIPF